MTHGALFSGSGGFELAGSLCGIRPLWASEIEPFAVAVGMKNFPEALHLGDISKLNGAELPPVDIISGGSPCQDMSIAGKRSGLEGSRSTLFHEQIRIVKEMREATNGKQPRYMVWENVPGAFSSNKGEDFRCVLEEIIHISEPDVLIPRPPRGGKWSNAGAIVGDGYSLAWRVFDAQYWGVPQRRRRIYLVADFGGECAPEILFKRESLRGDFAPGRDQGQEVAGSPGEGIKAAGFCTEHSAGSRSIGYQEEMSPTLRAGVTPAVLAVENHPNDSRVSIAEDGKVQTLTGRMGTGGGNVPMVMEPVSVDARHTCDVVRIADTVPTIAARDYKGGNYVLAPKTLRMRSGCEGGGKGPLVQEDKSGTITCNNDQVLFAFGVCSKESNSMKSDNPDSGFYEAKTSRTLDQNGGNPTCNQGGIVIVEAIPLEGNGQRPSHNGDGYNESDKMYTLNTVEQHGVACSLEVFHCTSEDEKAQTLKARDWKDPQCVCYGIDRADVPVSSIEYIVRRLTPLECCRLQGFPDAWMDDLVIEDPTPAEMRFWMQVFAEHWSLVGRDKGIKLPKNAKQVKRWLASEKTDTDKYKLWGNGIALPCAMYVFEGIAEKWKNGYSHLDTDSDTQDIM